MIEIDNTLISLDLLDKLFCCDLKKCKGICCEEGDSGAPLTREEVSFLEDLYPMIAPEMTVEARELVEKQGVAYIDEEGDLVSSIINGRQCVFSIVDKEGCYQCLIEKAHKAGKTSFRKPISCYLYPVRIKAYTSYLAVNYDRWDICSDACKLGKELKLPVYRFLKEPLIERFGKEWYEQLDFVAKELSR